MRKITLIVELKVMPGVDGAGQEPLRLWFYKEGPSDKLSH